MKVEKGEYKIWACRRNERVGVRQYVAVVYCKRVN